MKIGLIYPNEGKKEIAIHLGLGYIASYARKIHPDVQIQILDTRVAKKKEKRKFLSTKFDLIGITLMSGIFKQGLDIATTIKDSFPQTKICVGGPYVSTLESNILDYEAFDFAVFGEGELTFSELISCLKNKIKPENIDGLIHRDAFGNIIKNKSRAAIKNIDELPYPAYDLFKMNSYPIHRIVTSRGCPYKCSFCSSAKVWEFRWRKRSPDKFVEEISYLLKNYGRKTFFFNDDSFNMSIKRAEEICNEIIVRDLNILWSTPLRADLINPELAAKMRRAGCYNVGIGIESANNEILKQMEKQITIEEITKGIRIFKDAGIEVLGQFVIGSIGETKETFRQTLNYAINSELDFVLFYSVLPYKGTSQWKYVENHGKFLHNTIHEFHDIKPRVIFETPEFTYEDRVIAIQQTKDAGFYVDDNRLNYVFDFGRTAAKYFQRVLPAKIGNKLYLSMKSFYRNKLKDKWIMQ
jgi:anaerobic magnesium-protoporphyrin IX monomethyl ester cyclase